MQVIYADEVFILNAVINYLVLLASARLWGISASRVRLGIGSAIGGIYSVAVLFITFLRHPAVKLSVGVIMAVAAFGRHKRIFRLILTVFGVSAAFAGVIYGLTLMSGEGFGEPYIHVSLKMLLFSFGICYFIISVVFRKIGKTTAETVKVNVEFRGKSVGFIALRDTGHSLTDPITGSPIVITGADIVGTLLDKSAAEILKMPPIMSIQELNKMGYSFRLIPYSAVGVENGLLPAFLPDKVLIEGKAVKGALVAVSPNKMSDKGAYSALIGVD